MVRTRLHPLRGGHYFSMTEFASALGGARRGTGPGASPRAVLFDRDGTLVADVPYNTDPCRVTPLPTVVATVRMLREAGVPVGVVTNQSGVGRGLITPEQLRAVDDAIDREIGPFDVWAVCPHRPDAGCMCRKPRPGLIFAAAAALGVAACDTVVIGDIGADMDAAAAAGAGSVLVPTPVTREEEIATAPRVACDLADAVHQAFTGTPLPAMPTGVAP